MANRQNGFGVLPIFVVVIVLGVIVFGGWYVWQANTQKGSPVASTSPDSSGCPDPVLQMPTDIAKVTGVLYPGQSRGGQYKPHGGFRLDSSNNDAVTVKAPMDATLVDGSRYIEQNQQQVLLEFKSGCGVNFRLDHLLTLSPTIQAEVDKLPPAKPDDSRTTNFDNPISVKTGDVIATAVGFPHTHNVSFDFGVYDTRQPNAASKESAYQAAHPDLANNDQLKYAVCWIDYLPKADAATLKALPAGDQNAGKTSDYCR
jgi:hypothetical protein